MSFIPTQFECFQPTCPLTSCERSIQEIVDLGADFQASQFFAGNDGELGGRGMIRGWARLRNGSSDKISDAILVQSDLSATESKALHLKM